MSPRTQNGGFIENGSRASFVKQDRLCHFEVRLDIKVREAINCVIYHRLFRELNGCHVV
jgi:hypothetical protein